MIGPASLDPRPEPAKRRAGRRCIGLAFNLPEPVGRHELIADSPLFATDTHAAMGQLIRPYMLLEILVRVEARSGLKHHNVQPTLGEHLCRGPASCAGSKIGRASCRER